MDRIPLETLHQIFELACTDGGSTGCALALTSKFIREAAQSTRFYSIVLEAETKRLDALIALYQKCPNAEGVRPRTVHLRLSLPPRVNTRISSEPTEEDEWDEESEDEDKDEPAPPPQGSLVAAQPPPLQQLLGLVADTLQSLVITKYTFQTGHPLFGCAFPSLRELTLVLHTNPYTPTAPDSKVLPMLPALTHLHIVAPDMSPLLPTWIAHAPRVTHLRISAHCLFGKFVDELPGAAGTPEYPFKRGFRPGITPGPPPAVRTYPTLARVVVQPGPRPASGPCGTNRFVFNSRTMQLDWIAARARELGVGMYVLPPCAWTGEEWDEAIRTEWLKRVGGEASRDWFCGADEPEDGSDESDESEGDDSE